MVQYRTSVLWDLSLISLSLIEDNAITRKAGLAGLVQLAVKITAGAPANTAGKFIGGAIVQVPLDSDVYRNDGTTAAPNFVLI